MKLREYLAQFKDLDPELEVFCTLDDDRTRVIRLGKLQLFCRIGYVMDINNNEMSYRIEPTDYFWQKVLVLI
jgi:hypothetical protein